MNLLSSIITPFVWHDHFEILWPIVVQGILVSLSLGLIGCFLVVRGMSLLGDALSHSVLPGIVIGFLIGGHSLQSPWIFIGATAVGMAAAVLVQVVHQHSRVKEDASLGIVFTTLFAIGVVMINLYAGQTDLDAGCVLYGNIEFFIAINGSPPPGMYPMAGILLLILLCLGLFYRHVLISIFDPGLAISLGIPAVAIHYIMMGFLSLTVVTSFESVGAILAVALLIMPGATARLWTDRMPQMLLLASIHAVVSSVVGYWLSHEAILNTSASGAMTVAGFGLFLGSWLLSPHRGLLTRTLVRRRLRKTIAAENLLKAISDLGAAPATIAAVNADLRMPPRQLERTVRDAERRGWIQRTADQLSLTDTGRRLNDRLQRAHVLWEQYLTDQVGLAPDHVHDAAEWIEHHLDEARVDELDALLRPSKQTG
jgi:manganese/zinc/iron transport system permease protein